MRTTPTNEGDQNGQEDRQDHRNRVPGHRHPQHRHHARGAEERCPGPGREPMVAAPSTDPDLQASVVVPSTSDPVQQGLSVFQVRNKNGSYNERNRPRKDPNNVIHRPVLHVHHRGVPAVLGEEEVVVSPDKKFQPKRNYLVDNTRYSFFSGGLMDYENKTLKGKIVFALFVLI